MHQDLLKITAILVIICFLIYLGFKNMRANILEGMESGSGSSSLINQTAFNQNKASGAENYASQINKAYSTINDNLLVKDNRVAYEDVIIQMDDYISAIMLQSIVSVDIGSMTPDKLVGFLQNLNIMKEGKSSLNMVMKFIDGV